MHMSGCVTLLVTVGAMVAAVAAAAVAAEPGAGAASGAVSFVPAATPAAEGAGRGRDVNGSGAMQQAHPPPLPPPVQRFPSSLVGNVDEYYSGYEYQDAPLNESAGVPEREPGVIPDPRRMEEPLEEQKEEGRGDAGDGEEDEAGEGEEEEGQALSNLDAAGNPLRLPGDSLADADLHDHDLIDSVMYIYFGSDSRRRERGGGGRGQGARRVLALGETLALLAQLLAFGKAVKHMVQGGGDEAAAAFNTALALAASSAAWLLGAHSKQEWLGECVWRALLLHWLHAAAACWLLLASLLVLRRLRDAPPPRCRRWAPIAWGIPAALVAVCYASDPNCYETQRFCWVSVERGMLLSFLLPIGVLIVANTCVAVASLRRLSPGQEPTKWSAPSPVLLPPTLPPLQPDPIAVHRRAVRAAAALLPLFAVHWFLSVLALENPSSMALAVADTALNCSLNCFLVWSWRGVWGGAAAAWAAATWSEAASPAAASPLPAPRRRPLLEGKGVGVLTLVCASSPPAGDARPLLPGAEGPGSVVEVGAAGAAGAAGVRGGRERGGRERGQLLELRLDALAAVSAISA